MIRTYFVSIRRMYASGIRIVWKERKSKMEELETIIITFDDGEETEFFVLEQTQLMGKNYYLVAPTDEMEGTDEEGECYILKENMDEKDSEYGLYEFVEDEEELNNLFPIFEELLEESDTEVEF